MTKKDKIGLSNRIVAYGTEDGSTEMISLPLLSEGSHGTYGALALGKMLSGGER
jgi:hypothetical protein